LSENKLPISEKLKVLEGVTLYKSDKWWSAMALLEAFGRKQIAIYLWTKKDDQWKRKQKFVIHNKNEWANIQKNVEKFINQLK